MTVTITTFYRFLPLSSDRVEALISGLETWARDWKILGLCLTGPEGVNLTVSGSAEGIQKFKNALTEFLGIQDGVFKDSVADRHPYQFFKVKRKQEIVTLGKPELVPLSPKHSHLSPSEWQQALQDPSVVVLDTRNDYEIEIGKFRGAVDFGMKEFNEFPDKVKNSGLPKEQKILMYCTGGIRCEKAILEMQEQGYSNVYQLEGGILNYLKEYPEQNFEGDCFVFDYRVAVDQHLQPAGRYDLCPHCGQPATKTINCAQCTTEAIICHHCEAKDRITCSKNCAHHRSIGSKSRRPMPVRQTILKQKAT